MIVSVLVVALAGGVVVSPTDDATNTVLAVTVDHSPPTASFTVTPSTPNPDEEVTLDGRDSTDNGSIVTYEWDTDGDGNFGDFDDPADGPTAQVSFDSGGTYTVGLRVTDDQGNTDTTTQQVTVDNPAPEPAFTVTPSTPNPDDQITLDASGSSDPDGRITTYEWDTDEDGNFGDFDDPENGETARVSFETGGTYTVTLRVTDNGGKERTVTKQVTVDNPAPEPAFTVTPSVPNPDDQVTLDASGSSDEDGRITTYEWDTDGDGNYGDFDDPEDGETAQVAFDTGGTYTVSLRVTDNGGKTRTLTKQVTVDNPAPEPAFTVTPSTPNPDDQVTLDASNSSDADGRITTYEWDTDGDGNFGDFDDPEDGETAQVAFDTGGTYTVGLRVTDNGEKTRTLTKEVTVENPAPAANFTITPSIPNPDEELTLDPSGSSDPDGTIDSYEWDTDGGGNFGDFDDPEDGETARISFDTGGTYTVSLRVTDNGGTERTTSRQITVDNPPPTAKFTVTPSAPNPDEEITLDASDSSDPDGRITTYEWDTDEDGNFGDFDDPEDGETARISFDTGGTYTVSLRVTDNGETTRTVTKQVTVENTAPTANFSVMPSTPNPGDRVTLDASGSSDPDGRITTYEWDTDGDGNYGDFDDPENGETTQVTFGSEGTYTVGLRVTDNGETTQTVTRRVTVENPAPSANFTTRETDDPLTVQFDATAASDPDGSITDYRWEVDGSRVATGVSPTVSFDQKGRYTVTLTVTDNGGKTTSRTTTVGVSRPPQAVVAVSKSPVGVGRSVTFDGRESTDPDGSVESYRWSFPDGEAASGVEVSRAFAEPGSYTVQLTVTDDTGDTDTTTRTVTVREPPDASVSWTPTEPADDRLVTFTAESSADNLQYEWDTDDDGTFEASGATVEHRFPDGGSQTVTLWVTDESGITRVIKRTVTVRDVPPQVNVSWGPTTPRDGQDVVFRANGTDRIADYEWDFDNDGEIDATGGTVTHQFTATGEQVVTLRVTDEFGDTRELTRVVTVRQSATFSLSSDRRSVTAGETVIVRFEASNQLPDTPVEVKLNLELPDTGVSVSGVGGGELAGRSSIEFVTVAAGSDRGFQVRLRLNEPGAYEISATAVYFVGEGGDRRRVDVGPVAITVEPQATPTPTATATDGPGVGVTTAVAAVLLVALLARRRR